MSKHVENTRKNKKIIMLALILAIIIILAIVCGMAYARYVKSVNGSVTAQVANVVCSIDVKSSSEDNSGDVIDPADKTIINPYCIVTVKNYAGELSNPTEVTQTDLTYTITVSPRKVNDVPTFTMPQYTWYEIASPNATSGTKVAESPAGATGTLPHGQAQNKYYKIVFLNSGEQDVTRYVDFEVDAVQDSNI